MIKKMRKEAKIAGFSLAMAGLLTACFSGGGTTLSTSTGQFRGSYIAGVKYVTSSGITGYTDSAGHFKFRPGDTVKFYIGKLMIGSTQGDKEVYVNDLYEDDLRKHNIKDPIILQKAKNILYAILLSLNKNGNDTVILIDETEVEGNFTKDISLENSIIDSIQKGDNVTLDLDGDGNKDISINANANATGLGISGNLTSNTKIYENDEELKNRILSHAKESQLELLNNTLSKLDGKNVYFKEESDTPKNCYLVYNDPQIQLDCNETTLSYNIGTNMTYGYVYIANSTDEYIFVSADEEKEIEFLGSDNKTLIIELSNEETTTNTTELRNEALEVFGDLNGTAIRMKNGTNEYLCIFENFNNTNSNIGKFTNCTGTDGSANSTYDVYLTTESDEVYLELKDANNQTSLKEPVKNVFEGIKFVELEDDIKIFPYDININDVGAVLQSLNGTYIYADTKGISKEFGYFTYDSTNRTFHTYGINDTGYIEEENGIVKLVTTAYNNTHPIVEIDKKAKYFKMIDTYDKAKVSVYPLSKYEEENIDNYNTILRLIDFVDKNEGKPLVVKSGSEVKGFGWIYGIDKFNFKYVNGIEINGSAGIEVNNTEIILNVDTEIGQHVDSPISITSDNKTVETTVNGADYTIQAYSITLDEARTFLEGANNQTVNIYVGENGTTYNCTATFDSSSDNLSLSLSNCALNETLYLFEKDSLIWLDDNQTSPTEVVVDVDGTTNTIYLLDNYTNVDKISY